MGSSVIEAITKLQATKKAHELLQTYFEELDLLRITCPSDYTLLPIVSRLYQQMLKITMIHAVSRQIYKVDVIVDVEDVVFANQTVRYYYEVMKEVIGDSVFDNQYEANRNKIKSFLKKADGKGLTKGELSRKIRYLKKREKDEILEDLIEAGEIELVSIKRKDSDKVIYAYRII